MNTAALFFTSLALGVLLRLIYFLFSLIAKAAKFKAVAYIFDVVWCGIAFGLFALLTLFLGGGKFESYTVLGILAGLGITSIPFIAYKKRHPEKFKAPEKPKKAEKPKAK